MIKLFAGTIAAAVAMFVAAFLYFAGPLESAAYSDTGERESAAVQQALAANLPETGTYMVPNPSTQSGTILYGKGPVATVHYNAKGFPVDSADGMLQGFALYLVAAALMAGALSQLDRRVPDFGSRATIVICFALACSSLAILTDPIFAHQDWAYSLFAVVGNVLVLCLGGLILARWFLPRAAEPGLVAEQPKEAGGGSEVPPATGAGV